MNASLAKTDTIRAPIWSKRPGTHSATIFANTGSNGEFHGSVSRRANTSNLFCNTR
jgi:hypothetical protein